MKKRLSLLITMLILGSVSAVAGNAAGGEASLESGGITGKIEVRGVRDARDVVVYLEDVSGEFVPPAEKPLIDQENLVFAPHVLPVMVGTTVNFGNSDNVQHSVFSPSKGQKFNLGTFGEGVVREVTFTSPGVVAILCNVHAEMSAYIVILENPFFVLTEADGTFTIPDVPPGEYTISTWHEKLRDSSQKITVNDGETTNVNLELRR